jgi:hypothetical protein
MAQGSGVAVCQGTVGKHPLPRYGAVAHGNRLVRTRMLGGVGRGREKLPLTRFAVSYIFAWSCCEVRVLTFCQSFDIFSACHKS